VRLCHVAEPKPFDNYPAGTDVSATQLCNQSPRWRRHRGLSQLDLAGRTEISQRHLSFLELRRASPHRDMVTEYDESNSKSIHAQCRMASAIGRYCWTVKL
jgi:hypothetical protein